MVKSFYLHYEEGMPKGTAQQKGVAIRYKNGKPYVQHYKKDNVESARSQFVYKLNQYAPAKPSENPIKLSIWLAFDIKDKKLWGQYKTRRPDVDGYVKEFLDAMGDAGFFKDDAQIVDLRVVKTYAEKATIFVQIEELPPIPKRGGLNV